MTVRRILKNWSTIISGNLVASALSFAAIIVATRTLSIQEFGLLTLIESYYFLVGGIVALNTDQAVFRYGTETLRHLGLPAYAGLLKYLYRADLAVGCCAATLALIGILLFKDYFLGNDVDTTWAAIYCVVLATTCLGVPVATLRMSQKFGYVIMRDVLSAGCRLCVATVLLLMDGTLSQFLIGWMVAELLGNFLLHVMAWREFKTQAIIMAGRGADAEAFDCPGLWSTIFHTNLSLALRVMIERLDILIIGAIGGPAAAGIVRIAKNFSAILVRQCDAAQHAIFPDLAKLWTDGNIAAFKKLIRDVLFVMLAVAFTILVVISIMADPLIANLFGEQYLEAKNPMIIMTLAGLLTSLGNIYFPAFLSMGQSLQLLKISIGVTIVFFVALVPAFLWLGPLGASTSHLLRAVLWLTALHILTSTYLRYVAAPAE
ncbi:lipopolysaccharide biosynthesis protein (plasmid) [Skermanella sp. TT6]|uniref:Lipopolysaccharide biosynthesis protein n=1 Tax=Skermanella cutis TaxID=2775420 RepID=A0ABX7BEZ7_9PROT|nr:lipopolysaccharide biosynthesis protein [Skermanella sp. TT6]QQP92772.1 lipopolysaccharide biosynthesis protein [Skermanella sp. TT6]